MPGQVIDQRQEALGRDDIEVFAGPGRLGARGLGADQPQIAPLRGDGRRQDAADMGQPAIEPQFAQRQIAIERILRNGADGGHDAQRDGQVVVAALLGQVGRRQVDGDALGRQAQPRGDQRGADAFARFLDRLVGQARPG